MSESLHIVSVDFKDGEVTLTSEQAKVSAHELYRLGADLVMESGSVELEMNYFDEEGMTVESASTPFRSANIDAKEGMDVYVYGRAPENAVTASLSITAGMAAAANLRNLNIRWESQLELDTEDKEDLGDMVLSTITSNAAQNEYGELFFATNGDPALFQVIDLYTGERIFEERIPGIDTAWGIAIGSDENVYFSGTSNRMLYRYDRVEQRIENLGTNPSEPWVWNLAATEDGKIYGGTMTSAMVFEYDIASGTFTNLGSMSETDQYVRGIGATDRYIYAGIGMTAGVVRIDRETGDRDEVPIPNAGQEGIIANIEVYAGKLFIRSGCCTVFVIDEQTHELLQTLRYRNEISPPNPNNERDLYYTRGTRLYYYNMEENKEHAVSNVSNLSDADMRSLGWLKKEDEYVLIGLNRLAEAFEYKPGSGEFQFLTIDAAPTGVPIHSIEIGFDGNVYMGGYHRGMTIYDTVSEEILHSVENMQQSEGIGFMNGNVYFGTYGQARIYRYNPSEPFDYGTNPEMFKAIGEAQDRPFTLTSGDDHLFVGTIPDYGQLGGALSIYDETNDRWDVHRHVVQNQSIVGLAYLNGKVYGGTSIWGGDGSVPTEDHAKLFVWDVEKGEVETVLTPNVSGSDMRPKMIGELAVGPDGFIWGLMDGTVFAMNPDTLEIVKSRVIYSSNFSASKWRPFHLRFAPDGLIYTTAGRKLTVIDPETLHHRLIENDVHLMTVNEHNELYFASGFTGANLLRKRVINHRPTV